MNVVRDDTVANIVKDRYCSFVIACVMYSLAKVNEL